MELTANEQGLALRKQIEAQSMLVAYSLGVEIELTPELLENATAGVDIPILKDKEDWRPGIRVEVGTKLKHYGITYQVLQRHVTQADWRPEKTPALFKVVQGKPDDGEVLHWIVGEHVNVGDRRKYDGIVYIVVIAHQTQAGWQPPNVPALWEVDE